MVAALSLFLIFQAKAVAAQNEAPAEGTATEEKFNPGEAILHHIADSHEFHFFNFKKDDGTQIHGTLPLPVILYSPPKRLFHLPVFQISSWRRSL